MFSVNMLEVILPVSYRAKADISVADLTCLLRVTVRACISKWRWVLSHNDMTMPQFCAVKVSIVKCAQLSVLLRGHIACCTRGGVWT